MDSKRQLQTAETVRRHLGTVMQAEGSYIYGEALVTVTKVKVTPDISEAKIYLSIYNAKDKELVLRRIRENTPHLKRNLAHRIKKHVRRIPKIQFYNDETLDEANKMDRLLDSLKASGAMGEEE